MSFVKRDLSASKSIEVARDWGRPLQRTDLTSLDGKTPRSTRRQDPIKVRRGLGKKRKMGTAWDTVAPPAGKDRPQADSIHL